MSARDNAYLIGNKFALGNAPNRTAFKVGQAPWNKGKKGLRLSPKTEFKKGCVSVNTLPLGSVSVRRDKGKGRQRAFVKVGEPSVWKLRAVLIWEAARGPVPKGFVLHHKDDDSLHDEVENLSVLTRAEHLREHEAKLRAAAIASPKRMGWGPGGKRIKWRESWMQLQVK